ncbi:type I secretion protein (plasmid) [Ensifer adhaerens]|uniref:type I secretion protein n=1 Tax=Ensifer adhaerens TaxID=106592 RepID=UPI0023A91D0E|nr:type I secretion protein [Ensifer adhaerens]WDZ79717.1 type I secretion protein [Ensifer adhaerens]
MYSAKISETIAHFIGLFQLSTEDARMREAHEKFDPARDVHKDLKVIETAPVKVQAPYDLDDFNPDVPYRPLDMDIYGPVPSGYAGLPLPEYPLTEGVMGGNGPEGGIQAWSSKASYAGTTHVINPPGSVVVYSQQTVELSDNDFVDMGGHGLKSGLHIDDSATMAQLIDAAQQVSPLGPVDVAGSGATIASLVTTTAATLDAYSSDDTGQVNGLAASQFVAKGDTLEGIYVNGELVDKAPVLKDHLPNPDESSNTSDEPELTNSPKEASGAVAHGEGAVPIAASVELDAGSNTLVNEVVITSNWLQANVLAVAGDHVQLNAIIQTNVYSDNDAVGAALTGGDLAAQKVTEAFNIASFKHVESTQTAQNETNVFPKAWAITEIKGDLMMVNWHQQFTFMSDNDTAILAASGSKLSIIAGDNTAANQLSLLELGYRFDLIFVGGNVFDANIIQQTNILLDNDFIGAVGGFQMSGHGSVTTGGNLLWNYASIVEAGGAGPVNPMPESYLSALQDLSEGKNPSSKDFMHDAAFAGLLGLRVLYISGDLLSLNYIQQTNILGDNDQVTLAMNALTERPDADWTISTGKNALMNYAGIVDVDTGKTIYAGGGIYSDEVLVQAELIKNEPFLGGQDPNALASEAVVFLGDGMLSPDTGHQTQDHASPNPAMHTIDTASVDPMHSMVA